MSRRPLTLARRALALLALLGILGSAAAPACPPPDQANAHAGHCDGMAPQATPGHDSPANAPMQHHPLWACAVGMCGTIQVVTATFVPAPLVVPALPQSVETALVSVTPQHTTPPPRA